MSDCLLLLCELNCNSVNKNNTPLYTNSYKNLVTILGAHKIAELLNTKLDEIVVNVISRVFDLQYFNTILSDSDTILYEPQDTFYGVNDLYKIFKYIEVRRFQ